MSSVGFDTSPPVTRTVPAGSLQPVLVNGRFRAQKITGVQRYADEMITRLGKKVEVIEPRAMLKGPRGHVWEQLALPWRAKSRLLWSPCNTGPVWHGNQVVTIHDLFAIDYPQWFNAEFVRAYRVIWPRLARSARRIIAVSGYTRQRLIDCLGVCEDKVVLVHSGIGEQFASPGLAAIEEARGALGIPTRNYLLSVSSLEPRKNVRTILEAWERALPHLPADCWLVMAGATGSHKVFGSLNLPKIPDRVFFPGYVAEKYLPALYAGARTFVFPSLAEGFGFPALEAMACGTPVITSNNTSLIEVAGPAALLVDPLNADEIAHNITRLTLDSDLSRNLRDRGLTQAKKFPWNDTVAKTWAVLEREAAGHD